MKKHITMSNNQSENEGSGSCDERMTPAFTDQSPAPYEITPIVKEVIRELDPETSTILGPFTRVAWPDLTILLERHEDTFNKLTQVLHTVSLTQDRLLTCMYNDCLDSNHYRHMYFVSKYTLNLCLNGIYLSLQ